MENLVNNIFSMPPLSDEEQAAVDEYCALGHAVQSGIAANIGRDDMEGVPIDKRSTGPKHLRVGVNISLRDQGSLVALLISKGLITRLEYLQALRDGMAIEKKEYEDRLSERLGSKITLS